MGKAMPYGPSFIRQVRRRYEGVGLTEADSPSMVIEAIAEAFTLHPNTIWAWKARFGWERPAWYVVRRPYRGTPCAARTDVDAALLAAMTEAIGAPCPSNLALARRLACSGVFLRTRLRALERAGEIAVQRDGPHRRITLADGRATAWTLHRGQSVPKVDGATAGDDERRSADAVEAALRSAAEAEAPCQSTKALAARARCSGEAVRRILAALEAAGRLRIEHRPGLRRVVFPDGVATAWPAKALAPVSDPVASEAVRALQRMGCDSVFDVAVVTRKAWGVTWSVDGKLVGRDALIEMARERRARAMRALLGHAPSEVEGPR